MKQLENMPKSKIQVPKVVTEKKPKTKYVSPLKDYTVSYDAVIKIKQTSLQPIIPSKVRADKRKFVGKLPEEVSKQLAKLISEAIKFSCSFCSEVISVDNIKFDQTLIKEDQ